MVVHIKILTVWVSTIIDKLLWMTQQQPLIWLTEDGMHKYRKTLEKVKPRRSGKKRSVRRKTVWCWKSRGNRLMPKSILRRLKKLKTESFTTKLDASQVMFTTLMKTRRLHLKNLCKEMLEIWQLIWERNIRLCLRKSKSECNNFWKYRYWSTTLRYCRNRWRSKCIKCWRKTSKTKIKLRNSWFIFLPKFSYKNRKKYKTFRKRRIRNNIYKWWIFKY